MNIICPICKGKGIVSDSFSAFEPLTFIIPKDILPEINKEIMRIIKIAGINHNHPAIQRGLALEYICANSALTPAESLE